MRSGLEQGIDPSLSRCKFDCWKWVNLLQLFGITSASWTFLRISMQIMIRMWVSQGSPHNKSRIFARNWSSFPFILSNKGIIPLKQEIAPENCHQMLRFHNWSHSSATLLQQQGNSIQICSSDSNCREIVVLVITEGCQGGPETRIRARKGMGCAYISGMQVVYPSEAWKWLSLSGFRRILSWQSIPGPWIVWKRKDLGDSSQK